MKTLSVLKISFEASIRSSEISAFRSAFFRELGTPKSTRNSNYPLLQFKTQYSYDQQQPLLVCIGEHPKLLKRMQQTARSAAEINGRTIAFKVAHVQSTDYRLEVNGSLHRYNLFNYQALDEANYKKFGQLSKDDQKWLLGDRIAGHINNFAEGIGWQPRGKVKVTIEQIRKVKFVPYNGIRAMCFDLDFRSNVFLPEYVGLGKGVNKGFGVLRK